VFIAKFSVILVAVYVATSLVNKGEYILQGSCDSSVAAVTIDWYTEYVLITSNIENLMSLLVSPSLSIFFKFHEK